MSGEKWDRGAVVLSRRNGSSFIFRYEKSVNISFGTDWKGSGTLWKASLRVCCLGIRASETGRREPGRFGKLPASSSAHREKATPRGWRQFIHDERARSCGHNRRNRHSSRLGTNEHITPMGLGTGIWITVLGTLGGSSFVIAKRPDAEDLIDQIAPYQGGSEPSLLFGEGGPWLINCSSVSGGWRTLRSSGGR